MIDIFVKYWYGGFPSHLQQQRASVGGIDQEQQQVQLQDFNFKLPGYEQIKLKPTIQRSGDMFEPSSSYSGAFYPSIPIHTLEVRMSLIPLLLLWLSL